MNSTQTKRTLKRKISKSVGCNYLLFLPKGYRRGKELWPLILSLHGAGQRGDNLDLLKEHGIAKIVEKQPDFPFMVVSPQCPVESWWTLETEKLTALLDEIESKFRVDKTRIYVTGLSMGGFGTWQLALENPHRFAAIVPICGRATPILAERIRHLPIWAFHGAKDKIVPLSNSQEMIRALRKAGGNPKFTIYPRAEHDSWTQTYENPRLYKWLLSHRSKTRVNGNGNFDH